MPTKKAVCRQTKKSTRKPARNVAQLAQHIYQAKPKPVASTAERHGVFFAVVGKHTIAVYEQSDHSLIAASKCQCRLEYLIDAKKQGEKGKSLGFEIVRAKQCPIDKHRQHHGKLAS
jgi:hypothetical protein